MHPNTTPAFPGWSPWLPAPASGPGPFLVRSPSAPHPHHSEDTWLLKLYLGPDYEWASPVYPHGHQPA